MLFWCAFGWYLRAFLLCFVMCCAVWMLLFLLCAFLNNYRQMVGRPWLKPLFIQADVQGHECPCSLRFVLHTKQVEFDVGFVVTPSRIKRGMDGAPEVCGGGERLECVGHPPPRICGGAIWRNTCVGHLPIPKIYRSFDNLFHNSKSKISALQNFDD